MKDLNQLKATLTVCESVSSTVQYQVTGGKCNAKADDKRRERPGSTIGNRESGGQRSNHTCEDKTKG
ncbi:MAG: hypothetical protein RL757_2274 [Bacteroidota bacterium]